MKILHVIGRLTLADGGPPRAALAMAKAVADQGHQVTLFTTECGAGPPAGHGGAAVHAFPLGRPRFWLRSPAMGRALAEAVPRMDLVVIHSLYLWHSWKTARLCCRFQVPYIIRPHGSLDPFIHGRNRWRKRPFEWAFQRRDLARAAAIHFTSEEERDLARPWCGGAQALVVPLGVWPGELAMDGAGERLRGLYPQLAGRTVILFYGRLAPKKGLHLLIPAFARLLAHHPDCHLLLCGPDQGAEKAARGQVQGLGIAGRVTFLGPADGDMRRVVLNGCDLFVLPSFSENFALTVVEAMSCRRPVLVSDRVNIWREVVTAGAGAVVPPQEEALAAGLLSLLARREQWGPMGANGARLVAERFSWPGVGAQLADAYGDLVRQWTRTGHRTLREWPPGSGPPPGSVG